MKWYWAILLTIGLLALPYGMVLNGANIGVDKIFTAIVIISAIWAGVNSGSYNWGLFVFFVWPIAFPAYLIFGKSSSESGVSSPD